LNRSWQPKTHSSTQKGDPYIRFDPRVSRVSDVIMEISGRLQERFWWISFRVR
jgi:hypothetical protein